MVSRFKIRTHYLSDQKDKKQLQTYLDHHAHHPNIDEQVDMGNNDIIMIVLGHLAHEQVCEIRCAHTRNFLRSAALFGPR